MIPGIATFLSVVSILIYLLSLRLGFNLFSIYLAFFLSLIISLKIRPKEKDENSYSLLSKIVFSLPILAFILVMAFVLSPLIIPIHLKGFTFLRFPGIGDYNKHVFVTSSISNSGIPPQHPYCPSSNLSYYYGYYIIPAAIDLLTKFLPTTSLYFFVLFTTIISLLLIKKLSFITSKITN